MKHAYPLVLCLLSAGLVVASTAVVYLGAVLNAFYLLPELNFISAWFSVAPNVLMIVGGAAIAVSIYGVLIAFSANR